MAVLGTKSESIFLERIFSNSTTWTPSFSCRAYVTVIGPGGSAAHARSTSDNYAIAASGGGGGGCAKSLLVLSSSVTYTITIGAGGASVSAANGNAGGANSVFSGSDITTMTANLGSGGTQSVTAGNISTLAGGAGGAASGGNIWNVTGGAGGSATMAGWFGSYGNYYISGGGGAAGVLGEAFRGGNANIDTTAFDQSVRGGGAGVGGRGGDATITGGDTNYADGQGGCGDRAGADASTSTSDAYPFAYASPASGQNIVSSFFNYSLTSRLPVNSASRKLGAAHSAEQIYDAMSVSQGQTTSIFHGLTGQGGSAGQDGKTRFSGPGAGGSAYWPVITSDNPYACPGLFGGGGGTVVNYDNSLYPTNTGYGAAGSYGAGGGAIVQYASGSNTSFSGAGGSGLVVVTILEAL
jgi:hypothetical protein